MARFISLLTLIAALAFAAPVYAGVDTPEMPTINGLGLVAEVEEAGGTGESFVGNVIYFEADDTAAYGGPTAATIDTGDEACAVYGMTCFDVWTVTKGADADLTDSACDTDVADNTENLAFCY